MNREREQLARRAVAHAPLPPDAAALHLATVVRRARVAPDGSLLGLDISAQRAKAVEALVAEGFEADMVSKLTKKLEQDIVRGAILETGRRIDGRDTKTVRPIDCQVGVRPRAPGPHATPHRLKRPAYTR